MANLTGDTAPLPLGNGTEPPAMTSWPPTPQPQSELVQAINVVARAAAAKIAYHEAEVAAIRRALQPFQNLGKANQDVFQPGGDDAVTELLNIARKLGGTNAG